MATFNWFSQADEASLSFTPGQFYDVLNFDFPSATDPNQPVYLAYEADPTYGTVSRFSLGDKDVELRVNPKTLTHFNFSIGGGLFIFGDNTTSTTADDVANTVDGGSAADWLAGGGGSDVVNGSGGDDILFMIGASSGGVYGNDSLNGGTGIDTLVYAVTSNAINANLQIGTATGGDSASGGSTLSLSAIENIVGSNGNDTLTGDSGANLLRGVAGADSLIGGDGNDTLDGGTGNDVLAGGAGDDALFVDSHNDIVTELAGQGTDTLHSSITWTLGDTLENLTLTGSDTIDGTGNALANVIIGNDEKNVLVGGDGDDSLSGGFGDDSLVGNAGNDTLNGGGGDDTMHGGDGDDVYIVGGVANQDKVIEESANGGNDTVFTGRSITLGANVENASWIAPGGGGFCYGNALDNILTGIGQNVDMNGFGGIDTISYATQTVSVTIDLELGYADAIGNDSLTGFENALGGSGADTLIGDGGANVLDGNGGVDSMTGGYGGDTYLVDHANDVVLEADNSIVGGLLLPGGSGSSRPGMAGVADITDTVIAAVTYSIQNANFVENLTLSSLIAAQATGNTLANELTGGVSDDTLIGGAGNDTLDGGAGSDSMDGGAGNDVFFVNAALDVVQEVADGGVDTVRASVTETLDANVDNLVLLGTGNLNGTGNALANSITGNSGENSLAGGGAGDTLSAGAGNDTLNGGGDDDTMIGGSGDDIYSADSTLDVVTEGTDGGADLVQASATYALGSNVENLTLTGSAAIDGSGNTLANSIAGNSGENSLVGGGGGDTLSGGTGNDTLNGGADDDSMSGGSGDDVFVVDSLLDVVTEGAAGGADVMRISVNRTLASNVETLVLIGSESINGIGNELANTITGNAGANVLDGGAETDTLAGGGGNDTYIVDAADQVTESADGGLDVMQTAVTREALSANVESLVLTGTGNINGTGNELANAITGNAGANILNGGAGVDTLTGGAGNDTYVIDAGADLVVETGGGTDTVKASVNEVLANGVEKLVLTGAGAINGTGNAAANNLTGNAGNNVLDGRGGADTLKGMAGNDKMVWASTDTYDGGVGTDTLKVLAGNLNLTAVGNTKIKNVEQIDITGGGNNRLTLNLSDVLDISSTTNTLKVLGNAGDSVDIVGAFTVQGTAGGFRTYRVGTGTLLVDTDITVVI